MFTGSQVGDAFQLRGTRELLELVNLMELVNI